MRRADIRVIVGPRPALISRRRVATEIPIISANSSRLWMRGMRLRCSLVGVVIGTTIVAAGSDQFRSWWGTRGLRRNPVVKIIQHLSSRTFGTIKGKKLTGTAYDLEQYWIYLERCRYIIGILLSRKLIIETAIACRGGVQQKPCGHALSRRCCGLAATGCRSKTRSAVRATSVVVSLKFGGLDPPLASADGRVILAPWRP
jgi:hypothetical protein